MATNSTPSTSSKPSSVELELAHLMASRLDSNPRYVTTTLAKLYEGQPKKIEKFMDLQRKSEVAWERMTEEEANQLRPESIKVTYSKREEGTQKVQSITDGLLDGVGANYANGKLDLYCRETL